MKIENWEKKFDFDFLDTEKDWYKANPNEVKNFIGSILKIISDEYDKQCDLAYTFKRDKDEARYAMCKIQVDCLGRLIDKLEKFFGR